MFEPRIQSLLTALRAAHPLEVRIERVRVLAGSALPKAYRACSARASVRVTFQEAASLIRHGALDEEAVALN
jgi:hypothetical protein